MTMLASNLSILIASTLHIILRAVGLSCKHPYRVLVKGRPLWWATSDGTVEEIGGFCTNRVVMAECPDVAAARAIEIVRREIRSIARNPSASPVRIEIDECVKLDGLVTRQGGGFGFWQEKEGSREVPTRNED